MNPEFITKVPIETLGYEHPVSLDIQSPIKMPEDIFTSPSWFGDMVTSISRATETPIELPALLGLAVVASACQKKFVVELEENYQEPLNIWAVVALESGNRKTAVLQAMSKPIMGWEHETIKTVSEEIKEATAKLKNQEAKISGLRSQYGKNKEIDVDNLGKKIIDLEINLPVVPTIPRLFAQDIGAVEKIKHPI